MRTQHLHVVEENLLRGAVLGVVQGKRLDHAVERAAEAEVLADAHGDLSIRPEALPCVAGDGSSTVAVAVDDQRANDEVIAEIAEAVDPVGVLLAVEAGSFDISLLGLATGISKLAHQAGYVLADLGDESRCHGLGSCSGDAKAKQDVLAIAMLLGYVL